MKFYDHNYLGSPPYVWFSQRPENISSPPKTALHHYFWPGRPAFNFFPVSPRKIPPPHRHQAAAGSGLVRKIANLWQRALLVMIEYYANFGTGCIAKDGGFGHGRMGWERWRTDFKKRLGNILVEIWIFLYMTNYSRKNTNFIEKNNHHFTFKHYHHFFCTVFHFRLPL